MKSLLVSIALFCALEFSAQCPSGFKLQTDFKSKSARVEFKQDSLVQNLIVIITNSKGEMIFMDHRNRFAGAYKHIIDLSAPGNDEYALRIARDEQVYTQKIDLR